MPVHDAGMMTQQLDFSILTVPLAAIDRRSLSQAWYSALHLAQRPPGEAGETARARTVSPAACGPDPARVRGAEPALWNSRPLQARAEKPAEMRCSGEERRAQRSTLARRIEHAFLNPVQRTQRATFTIDGTRARVHVGLQSTASGTRLVALCPAHVRRGVARALEEARYALAVRGIALQIDLSELPS